MRTRCLLRTLTYSSNNFTRPALLLVCSVGLTQSRQCLSATSFSRGTAVQSGGRAQGLALNNNDSYNNNNNNNSDEKYALFVGNMPFGFTRQDFDKFLLGIGVDFTTGSRICFDNRGRSKGFGYVCFKSMADQCRAQASLKECVVEGRQLNIDLAEPRHHRRAGIVERGGGHSSRSRANDETVYGTDTVAPTVVTHYSRSIFMKNLAFSTTREDIEEYLSNQLRLNKDQFDVKLVCFRDGKSRGFGEIDFIDSDTASRAVKQLNGLMWHDREIRMQQFVSKRHKGNKISSNNNSTTLFLGNLDTSSTVKTIIELIHSVMGSDLYSDDGEATSKHKLVTNVRMGYDRQDPSKFLGYAHVDFIDDDTTFKAAQYLNGLRVESVSTTVSKTMNSSEKKNSGTSGSSSRSSSSSKTLRADISEKREPTHVSSAPRSPPNGRRSSSSRINDSSSASSSSRRSSGTGNTRFRSGSSDDKPSSWFRGDASGASQARVRKTTTTSSSSSSSTGSNSSTRRRELRNDADYDDLFEQYNKSETTNKNSSSSSSSNNTRPSRSSS